LDKQKAKKLIRLAYVLMVVWIVGALVYICDEMLEQQDTLDELRAIRQASEGWKVKEESLLSRGRTGLLYVLQEMQQNPEDDHHFLAGRALEKAGGRFHSPLTVEEKAAVRKLLSLAEARIVNYLDGIGGKLNPTEAGLAELAARLVVKYEKDARCPFPDAPVAAAAFGSVAAGEPVAEESAALIRSSFEDISGRIDRFIAGEPLELYPEERELFAEVLEYCSRQPLEKEELLFLAAAMAGLEKLAGKSIAECTKAETSALNEFLGYPREQPLPVSKLKEWRGGEWAPFTDDEKEQLLAAADASFRLYEDSQARLAETVVKFVIALQQAESRFIVYEVYEDEELREKATAFTVIFALWKKIDDKVMMVDMVEIAGSTDTRVRDAMVKALVTVGEPAIVPLLRSIRRDKIDQALAAETKDRTKIERLRELNETNKIMRLSCIRALWGIGGPNARKALAPLIDEDDPDIAAAADKALREIK
jgi:hypothetical protein